MPPSNTFCKPEWLAVIISGDGWAPKFMSSSRTPICARPRWENYALEGLNFRGACLVAQNDPSLTNPQKFEYYQMGQRLTWIWEEWCESPMAPSPQEREGSYVITHPPYLSGMSMKKMTVLGGGVAMNSKGYPQYPTPLQWRQDLTMEQVFLWAKTWHPWARTQPPYARQSHAVITAYRGWYKSTQKFWAAQRAAGRDVGPVMPVLAREWK